MYDNPEEMNLREEVIEYWHNVLAALLDLERSKQENG